MRVEVAPTSTASPFRVKRVQRVVLMCLQLKLLLKLKWRTLEVQREATIIRPLPTSRSSPRIRPFTRLVPTSPTGENATKKFRRTAKEVTDAKSATPTSTTSNGD